MRILLLGGSKSGKSMMGQHMARRLSAGAPMYYWATLEPRDGEDRAIVRRHLAERDGWGFETVEQGTNICAALDSRTVSGQAVERGGVFLLDSVTALLSNEMFRADGSVDFDAGSRIAEDLTRFAFDDFTDHYREALALCDRALAKCCDQVIEVSYGFYHYWKGL